MREYLYTLLFLLGLCLTIVSCGNVQRTDVEQIERQVFDTIEPKQVPEALENMVSFDTCADEFACFHNGYVFSSQPVPAIVRTRMMGCSLPECAKITFDELRYLTIPYYDYEGKVQIGEMVCNKVIARDLLYVFRDLFSVQYPIASIRLVDDFGASDEASMQANNTSCFNYRKVFGTMGLSKHAFGLAVDINPLQNPCVKGNRVQPSTAMEYVDRTKEFPHKIDDNDYCRKVFATHGFQWGGNWRGSKDYQHFEKRK